MSGSNTDKSPSKRNLNTYEQMEFEFKKMLSFFREYPDYFIDYIRTDSTRFKLTPFQRVFLRAFFRNKKVGIVASRGISKCVSGDSILFSKEGMVEIGSLSNYKKEEAEDIQNIDILDIDGKLVRSNIIVSNGLKNTKKIRTSDGYEIEGTHVHPLLVMDETGDMKFKQMDELSEGDFIAINRNNNLFGNNIKLDFDMDKYLNTLNRHQYNIHKNKCKTPEYLTEDFGYYLGLLIGDGCLTRDNCVLLSSIDEEIYDFFKKFNTEAFGLKTVNYSESKEDFKVFGKYFREYLRQIGFGFELSRDKRIPKCILEAPKNIISSFLQGLFDADATVDRYGVVLATSSKKMSKQVQLILLNFGIISRIKEDFNVEYKKHYYEVVIGTKNNDIFNKEIGFRLKRKQNKLNLICKKKRNPNKDVIPFQRERIIRIVDKNKNYANNPRRPKHGGAKMVSDFTHVYHGANDLTYERLEKLFEEYCLKSDSDTAYLLGLLDNYYYWDEIVEIKDSRSYVYDLHVPNNHTFIGNGFVNHNTYIDVMANYLKCMMYPNNHICLAMPTKTQSAKVVEEKVEELWKDYPLLKNELIIEKCKFQKDYIKLSFKNGSTLDTLTVGESSRGLRANEMVLEEIVDDKMDRNTINDVLLPILAQPRMTRHGADPNEQSKTQGYITTASHKQSYCYEKFMELFNEMVNGMNTIVLGTSYEMGTRFGTLDIDDVNEKLNSPTYSPLSFDREYRSIFTGSSEKSLVSIEDINKCRTLEAPEYGVDKKEKDAMYVLSFDIARAEGKQNAQSSLAILKCLPRGDGSYQKFLVNIYNMEGTHFHEQALFLKKMVVKYDASVLCIDHNGIGRAVTDILVTEIDGNPPYSVINDDRYEKYKKHNSIPMLYLISSNTREARNSDIVNIFMSIIANRDLNILKSETNMRTVFKTTDGAKLAEKLLPFVQTDRLIDEIMNLEYIQSGNTTTARQISRSVEKDRYSALAYGLFYIYLEEQKNQQRKKESFDAHGFFAVKKARNKIWS